MVFRIVTLLAAAVAHGLDLLYTCSSYSLSKSPMRCPAVWAGLHRVFDSMTEEQKNRYEAFMRSSLAKPKMKKVRVVVPMSKHVRCGQGTRQWRTEGVRLPVGDKGMG